MSEEINTKYVVMIETNKIPEAGNCDECEFHCNNFISNFDKAMIESMNSNKSRIFSLQGYYCPVKAYIDLEEYNKWKQEGKTHEKTTQITDERRERENLQV